MSSNRRALKVLSLIQFVLAIVVIVLAILAMVGGGQAAEGQGLGEAGPYLELAASLLLGILTIAGSTMGIRGANRPSALGKHNLVCVLGVVFGIAAVAVSAIDGTVAAAAAGGVTTIVDAAAAVFDAKVRKEVEDRR